MNYLYKLVTTEGVEINYDAFKKKEFIECLATMKDIYFSLKQENKHLDEVNCKLRKTNEQLKDNWNKLKEYINKMQEYFLYTDVNEIYKQSMKPDNPFPNLFNLSELNASDRVLNSICKKLQELERGSDKDV